MKIKSFLLVLIFALAPAMWAQDKSAQAPPGPGSGSLAQMKANLLTIKDPNELSRWRDNVDMWETVVIHMDRMQKNMESMGVGMIQGHGMGDRPPTPPTEKKPE
jgi:hypothetical protein